MLARRYLASRPIATSVPIRRMATTSTADHEAVEASTYSGRECTAILLSNWFIPLTLGLFGAAWVLRRSSAQELKAKELGESIKSKVLSRDSYQQWRARDPALIEFQTTRDATEAELQVKVLERYVPNPPHTFNQYRPPTISNFDEKPKKGG
eukprot:GDKJ01016688.1.p1 GENE.GDKJ01016688.1~~GDKJ01016688.1.p1  ORF type:complete len:152 (-),score=10.62 GDKJ01016688.1:82-537(-)